MLLLLASTSTRHDRRSLLLDRARPRLDDLILLDSAFPPIGRPSS